VYTARVPVHGTYTAVYTVRHGPYVAVYTARSRPCTQPCTHAYVYTIRRIHGPCTRPVHGSVNVRVHGPCTRCVYMAGRPTEPCTRSQTVRYGRVRPVTAVYTARSQSVHGSIYGRVRRPLHGRPTRAYVYTAVKRPCARQVHVRVHGQYTVVYMAGRPTRPCTRAETARYGHVHGRVHLPYTSADMFVYTVRVHGPCTRPRTRTVCRNGPHTAVACHLGTCTRPGRPTCRIHCPDGPCTRPSTRAVTRPCTRYVDGQKRQCTRPVYTAENGRAHSPYTAMYTSRYGPYTAVYTTRYTAV